MRMISGLALAAGVAFAGAAHAAPIAYTTLSNGVAAIGSVPSNGSQNDPETAAYFRFFADAGDTVTVTGARLENDFDMAFWLFEGLFADTDDFGGEFIGAPGFVDFGDDNLPPALPGPFGDPQVVFEAAITGFYTIAVVNFLSGDDDGGDGLFAFQIVADNIQNVDADVPEPAAVALFGLGALGLGLLRRRRAA